MLQTIEGGQAHQGFHNSPYYLLQKAIDKTAQFTRGQKLTTGLNLTNFIHIEQSFGTGTMVAGCFLIDFLKRN